jgi:hypothetical protein
MKIEYENENQGRGVARQLDVDGRYQAPESAAADP